MTDEFAKKLADKYISRDGSPPKDREDVQRAWSIMTKARNGSVSVVRDLTLDECREVWERLDPWYGMVSVSYEIEPGVWQSGGCGRSGQDGDIEIREVFGPPEWDRQEIQSWKIWPEFKTIAFDDPDNWVRKCHAKRMRTPK